MESELSWIYLGTVRMLQNVLLQNTDVDLDLFISNLYIDTIMEIFCGAPATSILKQSPML